MCGPCSCRATAATPSRRMPEAVKGMAKLDLLVVADPHPTTWASLSVEAGRKDGTYLLPACTQFESSGSRVASNRSLQWGEQIVKPIFETKDDYEIMYLLARKLGFADTMFKNIKVEGDRPVPEDILREINRGGWSHRLLRPVARAPQAAHGEPEGFRPGDAARRRRPVLRAIITACRGRAGERRRSSIRARRCSTTPILHVMDGGGTFRARFGVERNGVEPARRRLLFGRFGDQGRLSRIHLCGAEKARLGQGSHRGGNGDHPEDRRRRIPIPCRGRPICPAASSAWRSSTAACPTATPRRA